MSVFLVSGLFHEYVFASASSVITLEQVFFFGAHGILVCLEMGLTRIFDTADTANPNPHRQRTSSSISTLSQVRRHGDDDSIKKQNEQREGWCVWTWTIWMLNLMVMMALAPLFFRQYIRMGILDVHTLPYSFAEDLIKNVGGGGEGKRFGKEVWPWVGRVMTEAF